MQNDEIKVIGIRKLGYIHAVVLVVLGTLASGVGIFLFLLSDGMYGEALWNWMALFCGIMLIVIGIRNLCLPRKLIFLEKTRLHFHSKKQVIELKDIEEITLNYWSVGDKITGFLVMDCDFDSPSGAGTICIRTKNNQYVQKHVRNEQKVVRRIVEEMITLGIDVKHIKINGKFQKETLEGDRGIPRQKLAETSQDATPPKKSLSELAAEAKAEKKNNSKESNPWDKYN